MTAETNTATVGGESPGRPAQPERPAGYGERIDALVSQAPPFDDETRARLRVIFNQPAIKEAA